MSDKLKLYIENSVICMYYQDDAPYLRDLTKKFWKEVLPYYDAYVSEVVLDELRAIKSFELLEKLDSLIEGFEVIEISNEILKLTDIYLSYRRLPRMDALHLALASIEGMDFLATWNFRHLYKRGTQEMIREINTKLRIHIPSIGTPEDFLE